MLRSMTRTFAHFALAATLSGGCAPTAHIQLAPPDEALAGQLRAEIWSDLQSNALIGNGNELAARWANAANDETETPRQHIQNLVCAGGSMRLRCQFSLFREGGVGTWLGETAPDRLACKAPFIRSRTDGTWSIPRLPPRKGSHSRITIECEVAG